MNKELTPLQALEKLTKIHDHDEFNECYNIIETTIKALEIIKRREINIHALLLGLKRFDAPYFYNMLVADKYQMTQEEYDILKGVLL